MEDTDKSLATSSPESEKVLHLGQPGAWVLPSQQQKTLLIFLKGQPQVLGVAQILIGLLMLCLSITMNVVTSHLPEIRTLILIKIGYYLWGSITFLISGVLSIVAGRKMTKNLIQGSLAMNTISTAVAVVGIGVIFIDMARLSLPIMPTNHYAITVFTIGILCGMVILCGLEACIALSLSIFGCRVACSINKVVVYLPDNDSRPSIVSLDHIYDEVAFQ